MVCNIENSETPNYDVSLERFRWQRSELERQRELNNACRFAGLDHGLGRRRCDRGAAGLRENARPDTWRAYRRVAWVIKVRVIERIEKFSPELNFEPLSQLEGLDESEIEIPVMRRCKDIPSSAIRARHRQAKDFGRIDPAGIRITGRRVKSDWLK